MQILQQSVTNLHEGDRVVARRQRWRVVALDAHDSCAIATLAGIGPANAGIERHVVLPFESVRSLPSPRHLRLVSRGAWRRQCRRRLLDVALPGHLRTAAAASIELLPHQLEPAIALAAGRGTRLFLFDAVGLGKTVQAALAISELRARGAASRVLVLTPAGLRDQWCDELRTKFGLAFEAVDARALRAVRRRLPAGSNPWDVLPLAVASLDFAKRPELRSEIGRSHWDILVVDEAHHLSADSDRYEVVDALSANGAYLFLLTATPHSGDDSAFSALLGLGADERPPLVFRRTRDDVGLPVVRRVHRLSVRSTREEALVHTHLERFARAVRREHAAGADLALSVLKKRACSSAFALCCSVRRRLRQLSGAVASEPWQPELPLGEEDYVDPSDEPPAWTVPGLRDPAREQRLLQEIAIAAEQAIAHEGKLRALARLLRRIREPVVIFTEYRDTLLHLRDRVCRGAVLLHGGMSGAERRAALEEFDRGSVLLATDAGGEGLNLQHRCRIAINLELPWNPTRLEQRAGRVDRIGQRRNVHVFHLIAGAAGEGDVLGRLRRRLAAARASVGAADALGESSAPSALPACPSLRLSTEAASEMTRLALARRLLGRGVARESDESVACRARRQTSIRPPGQALVLLAATMFSQGGYQAASTIVPLLVEDTVILQSPETMRGCLEWARRSHGLASWQRLVSEQHAAFWTTRLAREESISRARAPWQETAPPATCQRGLFDRRTERTGDLIEEARTAQLDATARRRVRLQLLAALDAVPAIALLAMLPHRQS